MKNYIKIKCIEGSLAEKEWIFSNNYSMVTIGRVSSQRKNDLDVPGKTDDEKMISRKNSRIYIDFPKVYLSNWKGTYGTYLNGKLMKSKVEKDEFNLNDGWIELRSGDRIGLGASGKTIIFTIEIHADTIKKRTPSLEEAYELLYKKLEALRKEELNNQEEQIENTIMNQPVQQDEIKESDRNKENVEQNKQEEEKKGYFIEKVKLLGEGGYGTVDLVKEVNSGKLMALKHIQVPNEKVPLFVREANITLGIKHPNLVDGYSCKIVNKGVDILMEYCNAGNLMNLIKEADDGVVNLMLSTKLILQALDGLDYLHNVPLTAVDKHGKRTDVNGIVHRDIKLENILLSRNEGVFTAKIGDFGLAKPYDLAGMSGLTASGAVGGTYAYLSRRQLMDYKHAKPDVDVFAMAAVYYSLITGCTIRPFAGVADEIGLQAMIFSSILIPVRTANPEIPEKLANVIDGVLQEERLPDNASYTTAKEFKEKIIEALDLK